MQLSNRMLYTSPAHRKQIVASPTTEVLQNSMAATPWTTPYTTGPFNNSVLSPVLCRSELTGHQ